MFKIMISYRSGDNDKAVIKKTSIGGFDTFIEAAQYAEDYGEDNLVEVLITKQNK